MSAMRYSPECQPRVRLPMPGEVWTPEPTHDCSGGLTHPGVMGGWTCPCECHTSTTKGDTVIDVTECPDCEQKGTYEHRILIGGRGVYTCPDGHRWQDANEKPSNKGIPLRPPASDGTT